MIQGYRDKRTREFAEGKRVKEFEGFRRQAEKRLDILDAATGLPDLQALPSTGRLNVFDIVLHLATFCAA